MAYQKDLEEFKERLASLRDDAERLQLPVIYPMLSTAAEMMDDTESRQLIDLVDLAKDLSRCFLESNPPAPQNAESL